MFVEQTFHMLLYRAFHAQRGYLRPCMGELGLGPGQPKLLGYLVKGGPCRQRELADYFGIDPAAVSRMLDSLAKGDFIQRYTDKTDRRRELVALTEKGARANEIWQERCGEMEENVMLRGFTEEERARFADDLARVYQNFKEAENGE